MTLLFKPREKSNLSHGSDKVYTWINYKKVWGKNVDEFKTPLTQKGGKKEELVHHILRCRWEGSEFHCLVRTHFFVVVVLVWRCPRNSTVHIYTNGEDHYARFRFHARMFLRTHNHVFLKCDVFTCADKENDSRCRQGCLRHRKQSVNSTHHAEVVTLGPVALKGQRLTYIFLNGCVLILFFYVTFLF